ncbi:MAG: hypothetical protein IPK60_20165 [Sandaracinaceae bacterium]|nr:hypothetical protein [Sandaracinaceae bacterium]
MILDATLMLMLSMSGADLAPMNASSTFSVAVDDTHVAGPAEPENHQAVDPMRVQDTAPNAPVATTLKFPRGVCVDSGVTPDNTNIEFEVCMQPAYREGAPGLNFVGRF